MPDAIIVPNTLPPALVPLVHADLAAAIALCERAHAIALLDTPAAIAAAEPVFVADFAEANRLYDDIRAKEKALDEQRLGITRQLRALEAKVNETARAALIPLADQRQKLGDKIAAADAAQKALHRQRVEEAERAARAEEARLAAAAEEERRRRIAEAQAVAALDAAPGDEPAVVDAEPFDGGGAAAVRPVATAYVPPPVRSSVRVTVRKVLEVFDESLIPDEVNGVRLWIRDDKQIEKLVRAGLTIGGCRMVDAPPTSAAKAGG